MALHNVELLEIQHKHEKTWFQGFRGKIGTLSATVGSLAVSGLATASALVTTTTTHAFMTAADVDAATGSTGGDALLQKAGIWILGFVVGMTLFAMLVSMLKKK